MVETANSGATWLIMINKRQSWLLCWWSAMTASDWWLLVLKYQMMGIKYFDEITSLERMVKCRIYSIMPQDNGGICWKLLDWMRIIAGDTVTYTYTCMRSQDFTCTRIYTSLINFIHTCRQRDWGPYILTYMHSHLHTLMLHSIQFSLSIGKVDGRSLLFSSDALVDRSPLFIHYVCLIVLYCFKGPSKGSTRVIKTDNQCKSGLSYAGKLLRLAPATPAGMLFCCCTLFCTCLIAQDIRSHCHWCTQKLINFHHK